MPNQIQVRPIEVGDFPQVKQLLQELAGIETQPRLEEFLENNGGFALVVTENSAIIGFGALSVFWKPDFGKVASLEDVIVTESARGRGVGAQLVEKLLEIARQEKIEFVNLTSNPTREAAINLYKKLGFREREATVMYLKLS